MLRWRGILWSTWNRKLKKEKPRLKDEAYAMVIKYKKEHNL